jgi:hypothetical protein
MANAARLGLRNGMLVNFSKECPLRVGENLGPLTPHGAVTPSSTMRPDWGSEHLAFGKQDPDLRTDCGWKAPLRRELRDLAEVEHRQFDA